ncbi:MAG: hypothetical protein II161_03590 [Erysipelotrichaceae bacterium]|nr:hypothetical protein [Erysipelotrichaceae bacterium]
MKQFSVPMALVDYIPVILFALAACMIAGDLKKKINSVCLTVFAVGSVMVTAAGFLKATYKLLYALKAGDFIWMSNQFFTNQAIGFLLAGTALVIGVVNMKKTFAFLPTMALVGMMVIGVGALDAGLCFLASRMKKRNALICFIVSFFLSMTMGYLSSKDFDGAFMNWLAQGINILGEGLLYAGVRILHNAGLNK